MKQYTVLFTYPDGHSEKIEETFSSRGEAVEYGVNLLNQVRATETFKKEGLFSEGESSEPFFVVYEVDEKGRKMVFNSFQL